jgi:hypothetical protein
MSATAIRDFLAPLLPGWRIQFGRWVDGDKTDRYAVIRPVGGGPSILVRRPAFSVMLIGAYNEAPAVLYGRFTQIFEAARIYTGPLVTIQLSEPVYMPTNDGRPVFELSIATIASYLSPDAQNLVNGLSPAWDSWAGDLDESVSELPQP